MNRWQQAIDALGTLPDYMIVADERIVASDREQIVAIDPGSGALLTRVPAGTSEDIAAAVHCAQTASHGPWRDLSPKDRCRLLWNAGELVRSHIDRLSIAECLDTGKPLRDARTSVARTADFFCYYAGMVDKLQGESIPLGAEKVCFTELVPIGVSAHIVPWNVPISMIARSLAPALACGNTAVIKPAEDTPLTALLLTEILLDAGIPGGVINVVTGYGHEAGAELARHPDVRHITFTGSVKTGKSIMQAAADHLANVTLEPGGKSPHVILQDTELDRVVPSIVKGIFTNAGQICSSGSRLLVERNIHRQLVERLKSHSQQMILGHGLDNPDMGSLISRSQLEIVSGFVQRARERGLNIVCGGNKVDIPECEGGNFYAPTIVDNVDPDDELAQAEIFGPVLSVIPVDDVDHAIEVANNSAFGLAAGMKAAVTAAGRGHHVTLYEAGSRPGGQVWLAQQLPGRSEFGGLITNLMREIEIADIEVKVNTTVDVKLIRQQQPDAIVLATGALPYAPDLEQSDDAPEVDPWSVIDGSVNTGHSVVIADWRCDWIGLGLAEKLAREGCQVRLCVSGTVAGESIQPYVRDLWNSILYSLGVTVIPYMRLVGVDANTAYLQHTVSGQVELIEQIDSVVLAQGHRPRTELEQSLIDYPCDIYPVGDCLSPRTAEEAILEGMKIGHLL